MSIKELYSSIFSVITDLMLRLKQFFIHETTRDAINYIEQKIERIENSMKELEREN